jgi:hypothetical protein
LNEIGPMQNLVEYVTDPIHDCFSPLDGTGLFPVTATLNHSCEVRDDVIMTARPGQARPGDRRLPGGRSTVSAPYIFQMPKSLQ